MREVVVIRADEPLVTAARLMRDHGVRDVVVVALRGSRYCPVGVLSDRDIVVGPLARSPETLRELSVGDVTRIDVSAAGEHEDVLSLIDTMRRCGVRRLPVVDGTGRLVGLAVFEDIVELLARALTASPERDASFVAAPRELAPPG